MFAGMRIMNQRGWLWVSCMLAVVCPANALASFSFIVFGDLNGGGSYEDKMAGYLKITVDGALFKGEMKSLGVSETKYPGRIVDRFQYGATPTSDDDADGIPDAVDREPQFPASPDCSADPQGYVEIANKTYTDAEQCTASSALHTGVAVKVERSAQVRYTAPHVRLFPGFSVALGGHFEATTGEVDEVPQIAGCRILPGDSIWNTPVNDAPLHPNSAAFIASIGSDTALHADFGSQWQGNDIGIPFDIVPENQPLVPVRFNYWDESDRDDKSCNPDLDEELGCYPIPDDVTIEGQPEDSGDRHALLLQQRSCLLYELYALTRSSGSWEAGSGAIWDLRRNQQRPDGWTSADAAGLPILPGLLRYDEVMGEGEINHAIRVTVSRVRSAYIRPASHSDGQGGNDPDAPPMGLRLRLKADFDLSNFDPVNQKILRALKRYGVVIADTGGDLFILGQHHDDWDDDLLHELGQVTAADFEAVYSGEAIDYP